MMQNLSQERSLNPIRTRPLSGARFAQRRLGQLEFSIGSRIQAIPDVPLPDRSPAQDLEPAIGRAGETVRSIAANPIPGLKVRWVPLPRKSKRNSNGCSGSSLGPAAPGIATCFRKTASERRTCRFASFSSSPCQATWVLLKAFGSPAKNCPRSDCHAMLRLA